MATATRITRQPEATPTFVAKAGTPTRQRVLPPTLRARQAPAEQLEAAWRLARCAIGYAAEQVPAEQAETSLAAMAARDPQVLDLAADYLGYTDMADSLRDQVDALFMVEHARNLPRHSHRPQPAAWAARIARQVVRRRGRPGPAAAAA